jgi:hypothetical protein
MMVLGETAHRDLARARKAPLGQFHDNLINDEDGGQEQGNMPELQFALIGEEFLPPPAPECPMQMMSAFLASGMNPLIAMTALETGDI